MGSSEHFLVTGALGCLGSWVVKRLVDDGIGVSTLDLSPSDHRLRLTCDAADLDEIDRHEGDVADLDGLLDLVDDIGVTHIVHLAGLQVPFVRADPVAGARVNVVGTAAVLDVARRRPDQIEGLVFASSGGVFGRADQYPQEVLDDAAPHHPPTIYGVYKSANEQMARLYWSEYQVPSIGLRPFIVYGPGRDQGMTSSPTKAMLAAAVGRPYHLAFNGRFTYQHADDAAGAFIAAARAPGDGGSTYNLGGTTVDMLDVVDAIETVVPAAAGTVTVAEEPLSGPHEVDGSGLETIVGPLTWRPLLEGVAQTIEHYQAAIDAGLVDVDRILA
jgi:UDP-glucuronate 4-epimerase